MPTFSLKAGWPSVADVTVVVRAERAVLAAHVLHPRAKIDAALRLHVPDVDAR